MQLSLNLAEHFYELTNYEKAFISGKLCLVTRQMKIIDKYKARL